MDESLPEWMTLRHDQMAQCWVLTCRICGIRERWTKYRVAARVACTHAEMHDAQLLRLGPVVDVSAGL